MKSAFDLAMERFGGPIKELSSAQKSALQKIDNKFKAKLAEAELAKDERIIKANGDFQKIEQIREDYVVELASLNSKKEQEKENIRNP